MIKKIFSDKLFVALFILYSVAFLVVAIAGASGAFNKYNTMREFSETGALGFVLFAYISSLCGIGIKTNINIKAIQILARLLYIL